MNYEEAHEYLDSLLVFGIKLGLDNMKAICSLLGNPEKDLKFIHVAGTNGKGSTCAMMAAAFKNSNLKTGFYSSPFLYRFTERWRVNGEEVSEVQVADAITEIAKLEDDLKENTGVRPTYFEVLTAAALLIFKKSKVDIVVWETGMGGRLDATNVVVPILSVITNIELDHTQYLGDTILDIAYEKGGIIKPGIPFLCGDEKEEVQEYFSSLSEERNSPVRFKNKGFSIDVSDSYGLEGQFFRNLLYKSNLSDLSIKLPTISLYQCENASLAIAALEQVCEKMKISFDKALSGLESFIWPGRMERRSDGLILDGAHNPIGAKALVEALNELSPVKKYHFICGILSDKNWQAVLEILSEKASSFYFVEVSNERTSKSFELKAYVEARGIEVSGCGKVQDALSKIEKPDSTVVVGSLYLIGEALQVLNGGEPARIDSL